MNKGGMRVMCMEHFRIIPPPPLFPLHPHPPHPAPLCSRTTGGGEPPRCLASRLLVAGFWFFSVVIMSTFTANLAAFLTVSRMGTTIASLDELAAQSDVR